MKKCQVSINNDAEVVITMEPKYASAIAKFLHKHESHAELDLSTSEADGFLDNLITDICRNIEYANNLKENVEPPGVAVYITYTWYCVECETENNVEEIPDDFETLECKNCKSCHRYEGIYRG